MSKSARPKAEAAKQGLALRRNQETAEPLPFRIARGGQRGDRVRQVVSGTTTYYTLDVEGLPEVITSAEEIYLHLPGVIVTEKAGQVRYLLGDGLGSIRHTNQLPIPCVFEIIRLCDIF